MANTNQVGVQKVRRFFKRLENKLRDAKPALQAISLFYHNATIEQFKQTGGLYGRAKWSPIDPSMYTTRARKDGKGQTLAKIRYGTDGGGKGKNRRRFTSSSQPLQASSGYRFSFKQQTLTKDRLVFGSKYEGKTAKKTVDLAKMIQYAGGKERYVLPVWEHSTTQSRVKKILADFVGWVAKG